jgi:hypothetical protein
LENNPVKPAKDEGCVMLPLKKTSKKATSREQFDVELDFLTQGTPMVASGKQKIEIEINKHKKNTTKNGKNKRKIKQQQNNK